MLIFNSHFIKFFGLLVRFWSSVIRHMCIQCLLRTKLRKIAQRTCVIVAILWGLMTTICKMAVLMFRCWMKTTLQFTFLLILQKARVT